MAAKDPFAFDSQEYIPLIMKELPPGGKTPVSVKKKSPRVASSRQKEEDEEKKALKRAIEESKKTALREERARRYNKRMAQQKPAASGSESETDSCSNVCSPTQSLTTPPIGKGKGGLSSSRLKPSPFVKDSTPTLEETAAASVEEITLSIKDAVPSSKAATAPMEITPSKGNIDHDTSGSHLKLKRKRLMTSSKEPAIKLVKVDTGSVGRVATGRRRSSSSEREVAEESEAAIKEDTVVKGVQENKMVKNTAKERQLVTEGVKPTAKEKVIEEDTIEPAVKEKDTIKPAVKEKDTIKPAVKEKDTIKQALRKKDTPIRGKKAIKKKDLVRPVIKKTTVVQENEMLTEIVREEETSEIKGKGAVKEKDVTIQEIKEKETVKQNEAVKEKEMIKGTQAVGEQQLVKDTLVIEEVVKDKETVKNTHPVKEVVKEKEIIKEVVKSKVSITANATNSASPRPYKSLTLVGKKPTAYIDDKRTDPSSKKGKEINTHSLTLVGKKPTAYIDDKRTDPSSKKGKEINTHKTTVVQNKLLNPPQLYAPRGTKPSEYLPVTLKFFEDFKFQLKMAQSNCVSFVPWSLPAKTRKEDNYTERKSSSSLVLSPPIKHSQQRKKRQQEAMNLSPVQDWGHYIYNSDDQKLFNDSDYDIDPRPSQPASTFDCRQPPSTLDDTTDTVAASNKKSDKPTGVVSPHRRDISIDISSSDDSDTSSVITKKRRKPVGRRLMADITGDIAPTPEADGDQLSLTPSYSRTTLQPLSPLQLSPPQSPVRFSQEAEDTRGVIDLTDEMIDQESPSRPSTSTSLRPLLGKQVTCPICKQLFSETYIETHAANCDLHVETAVPVSTNSTRYKQTTLVRRPYKRPSPPSSTESDNERNKQPVPSTKKTYRMKKRKLLSKKTTTSIPLDESESDDIEAAPQETSYLSGGNASAVDAIFESSCRFGQEMDDIASYSSEEEEDDATTNTRGTIIDYRNQFPAPQMGKVSKELLTGNNTAFIEARQKKWMNSKRGKSYGRGAKKKWGKSRGRGKGKK